MRRWACGIREEWVPDPTAGDLVDAVAAFGLLDRRGATGDKPTNPLVASTRGEARRARGWLSGAR